MEPKIKLINICNDLGIRFQNVKPKMIKTDKYQNLICYGKTDIGTNKIRKNNDDYYNVFIHPVDESLIMSIVADGVGGFSNGDIASLYVTEKLGKFFYSLTPGKINNTKNFCLMLQTELNQINKSMCKFPTFLGFTTLSCAIINQNDIVIANVGDSRIYTYDEQGIKQITDDDSEVWANFYQTGLVKKADMRFITGDNIITNAFGDNFYTPVNVQSFNHDKIKALLLTTDGVTDIVSDEILQTIFQNNLTNPIKVIDTIIDLAIHSKHELITEEIEERIWEVGGYPRFEICPGKDNATAILTLIPKK